MDEQNTQEPKKNIELATLLRARKAADEAHLRVAELVEKLKSIKPASEIKKIQIGLKTCSAVLNKQIAAVPYPLVRKKTPHDAAVALAEYIEDDPEVKEYEKEELVQFFIEFGTPRTNEIIFDDEWFQDLSDKFRISLKSHNEQQDWFSKNDGEDET